VGPAKGRLNARKHGVQFADSVAVLEDERALTMRDPSAHEEERWVTLGWTRWGGPSWSCTPGAASVSA